MKQWLLVCSTDGNKIDWTTVINSDSEPDFWTCYDLATSHGCEFFTVDEAEHGMCFLLEQEEYEKRILAFFKKCFNFSESTGKYV